MRRGTKHMLAPPWPSWRLQTQAIAHLGHVFIWGNCPPSQKIFKFPVDFPLLSGELCQSEWLAGYVFMTYLIRYICFFSTEKCSNVRLRVHSVEIQIFWVSILVNWVPWGAWVDYMVQNLGTFCMQFCTCQMRKCWLPFWVTGWSAWQFLRRFRFWYQNCLIWYRWSQKR